MMMKPSRFLSSMYCRQCEQTMNNVACTTVGVCGKTPAVAHQQDELIGKLIQIGQFQAPLKERDSGVTDRVRQHMFSTLTNVNFNESHFKDFLREAEELLSISRRQHESQLGTKSAANVPLFDMELISSPARQSRFGEDLASLQEICLYGLKGMTAYAEHAATAGITDPEVDDFMFSVLAKLAKKPTVDELLPLALDIGRVNLRVMDLLYAAHAKRFGAPSPTEVRVTPRAGKCILISGHDMVDLESLLKATEGKGIDVYTHGEMLPAHAYPKLRAYPHLAGNYGGAWQDQKLEFASFPGAIVMSSNCVLEPRKSYADRLFTRRFVNVDGMGRTHHIDGEAADWSEVIQCALDAPGFTKDVTPERKIPVGFGHEAVLGIANVIIDAVKEGKISHFFLIGGCDGTEGERNYFSDLALETPKDSMILTLGCGKNRLIPLYNRLGSISLKDGVSLPRVLDMGQCNDANAAVHVAVALAKAFNTDVNSLPLSFAVSHLEQKAAAVLLTLLHLNIQNIRLGPRLPAFISPNILKVLVEKFKLHPVGNPKDDVAKMLRGE